MSDAKKYTIGFVLSLLATWLAYSIAVGHLVNAHAMIVVLVVLAVIQLVIQLVYFLHFGSPGSKWNMLAFVFMGIVLLIIVVGSLWIMANLDYNMMQRSPDEKNSYMIEQSNKGF